jgi:hypothetical protein
MPRAMSIFCWREIPYSCGMMKLEMRLQARYLRDVCGVMLCDAPPVLYDAVMERCDAPVLCDISSVLCAAVSMRCDAQE